MQMDTKGVNVTVRSTLRHNEAYLVRIFLHLTIIVFLFHLAISI